MDEEIETELNRLRKEYSVFAAVYMASPAQEKRQHIYALNELQRRIDLYDQALVRIRNG